MGTPVIQTSRAWVAVAILIAYVAPSSARGQTVAAYELDIFYRSKWVGDTSTRIEKARRDGKPILKAVRKTTIVASIGRMKPMFTELSTWYTESGEPIELRYTYSSGLEAQEMRVEWLEKTISVERNGFNGAGRFEPTREVVDREKADRVGGSPLDSLLLGRAGKGSSVTMSMNFDSKKLEEHRIEFVGESTVLSGDSSKKALEFRVRKGGAVLYKVFLDATTELPLRIESIDGMLMLPKKRP